MKQSETIAAICAGVGVVVILVGALLWTATPRVRDAIHGSGLVCMLMGAGVFLLGRRAEQTGRARTVAVPSGWQETSKNLAIAGATFLIGAMATGMALVRVLSSHGLLYWILLGVGLLGAAALVLGAAGYALALMFAPPQSRERRETS
jgi:hypothetical protein